MIEQMRHINKLKRNARRTLRHGYFGIAIACVMLFILSGIFGNPITNIKETHIFFNSSTAPEPSEHDPVLAENARHQFPTSNKVMDTFLGGAGVETENARQWTRGVLSIFANSIKGTGSLVYGTLNVINQFAFEARIGPGIIVAVGLLLYALIHIFVINVLLVGINRYLLESRVYTKSKLQSITFAYNIKRARHTAWVMLVRLVFQLLWFLTIAGGFIKLYSYRLVPFILAENPDISARDALKLSEDMMMGHKRRAFLLDLSYAGWYALCAVTVFVLIPVFVSPYHQLAGAELYMELRSLAKKNNIRNAEKLCDELLCAEVTNGAYPMDQYIIPVPPARRWITADYNCKYTLNSLILLFFSFSIIGWIWEVALYLFTAGEFINRGVAHGPWLPIYGIGVLAVLICLKGLRDKPLLTFLASAALCGTVEYIMSAMVELVQGMRWWDYSGYFLNLNGRICLEGVLVFGMGSCAAIYLIAPALNALFEKIPKKTRNIVCAVLIAVFIADQVYSFFYPNAGKGITDLEGYMI